MNLSVPEGPANSNNLTEGGTCEGNNESLAIPKVNLDDFSFRDSKHRCLCHAIVAGDVVSQLQTHFLIFGAIPGHTRACGQGVVVGVGVPLRDCAPEWITQL